MKNKVLTTCLVLFFFVMLILAVVAQNIYYDSLPEVVTGLPREGNLTATYPVTASVVYGRLQYPLHADGDFGTVTLLAQNGVGVDSQTPIYSVPAEEVLLVKKRLEVLVLDIKEQDDALGLTSGMSDERSRLLQEIILLQLDDLNRQIEALEYLYDNGGIVYADYEGIINYSVAPNSPVRSGQEVAVVAADTRERFISWQMPAEEGELFAAWDSVDALLTVAEPTMFGTTKDKMSNYPVVISVAEYYPQSQTYGFTAKIRTDLELAMEDGARVAVTCKYKSNETYDFIIPTSAITFESETRGQIFLVMSRQRVYGEEYYVVPYSVDALRTLGDSTAVSNIFEDSEIVFASDKALADNVAVKRAVPLQ